MLFLILQSVFLNDWGTAVSIDSKNRLKERIISLQTTSWSQSVASKIQTNQPYYDLRNLLANHEYTAQPHHDLEMLVKAFFSVRDYRFHLVVATESPLSRLQLWKQLFSLEPWRSLHLAAHDTKYDELISILQTFFN